MTSRMPSQCVYCARFRSPLDSPAAEEAEPVPTCDAFPTDIPVDVWWNRFDHRKPFTGDSGLRWMPDGDVEYPDWALDEALYSQLAPSADDETILARSYKRDKDGKFTGGTLHASDEAIHAAYDYHDAATGMSVEVRNIIRSDNTTYMAMDIKNAHGRIVGSALRTVALKDTTTVEHASLVLNNPEAQGQGFATRFNAHAEEQYRQNGIKRIRLSANIDVGGYAWARAGYDFHTPANRKKIADRAVREGRKFSVAVQSEIAKVAADPASAPIHFAMIGHVAGASTWPGKQIMLGSKWEGVREL